MIIRMKKSTNSATSRFHRGGIRNSTPVGGHWEVTTDKPIGINIQAVKYSDKEAGTWSYNIAEQQDWLCRLVMVMPEIGCKEQTRLANC